MSIIGWIRLGDKAACGATVVEAFTPITSRNIPLTYQGAKLNCGCVIVEGHPSFTLPNGQRVPHHGHLTSGKCPLLSTINGVDGWSSPSASAIPVAFLKDATGQWVDERKIGYDQHFLLTDQVTGDPLRNRFYRLNFKGKIIEGRTDSEGKTQKVSSETQESVVIEVMPEGYEGEK